MINSEPALEADRYWLEYICKGSKDAAEFLHMFFMACHVWDDLIDKDVERSDEHINHAFWIAFVEIPRNRYYRANMDAINAVMGVAIQEWFTANALEKGEASRRDISYTLRCSIVELIHQAAEWCGGYEWAVKVGPEIRLVTQNHSFDEYVEELDA